MDGLARRLAAVCLCLPLLLTTQAAEAADEAAIEIGRERELLVDDYLIDSMSGVELRLHHPVPGEVVFALDAPWEGNTCAYVTVFRDGGTYRMYYRGSNIDVKTRKSREQVTCYAQSEDGLRWTKPNLGIIEYENSTKNNIIWTGEAAHNFCPFKDSNPDCPPEARYKAVGFGEGPGGQRALAAFVSPDGLHWKPLGDEPIITDGKFDSQNLAFWDEVRGEYRAYYRDFREGFRDIKTSTSKDFVEWTPGKWLQYGDAPREHLYTNQIRPYYRAPHLLIGFPTRYVDRGSLELFQTLPDFASRRERSAMSRRYGTAITEGLLMTSRDRLTFHRWKEAFLRPGPRTESNWSYGDNYLAWHVVQTAAREPGYPDELSLYATESYWTDAATRIRRYTLRIDGFASAHASYEGGELVTRPLRFAGDRLSINFATSAAGSLKVEIQDAVGQPIDGFRLEDCRPIFGDQLDRTVTWTGEAKLSELAGRPVRLRVVLQDADLYSFQFAPAEE
jgi:hypothetical protein